MSIRKKQHIVSYYFVIIKKDNTCETEGMGEAKKCLWWFYIILKFKKIWVIWINTKYAALLKWQWSYMKKHYASSSVLYYGIVVLWAKR